MRFCRGFICYSLLEIQLECALFVPYNQKNTFSEHFDRPEKSKCQVGQGPHDDFRLQSAQGFCGPVPGSLYSGGNHSQRCFETGSGCRSKGLGCFPTSSCRARAHDFQRRSSKQRLRIFGSRHLLPATTLFRKTRANFKKCYNFLMKKGGFPLTGLL